MVIDANVIVSFVFRSGKMKFSWEYYTRNFRLCNNIRVENYFFLIAIIIIILIVNLFFYDY